MARGVLKVLCCLIADRLRISGSGIFEELVDGRMENFYTARDGESKGKEL